MNQFRKVTVEMNINTSKDEVWDILFNRFGEVNIFNPLIESSHYIKGTKGEVGCERQCNLNSNNYVHERISGARGTESMDIDIFKGSLPMIKKVKATINLRPLHEQQTRVSFTMHYIAKPFFMGRFMKGGMNKMINKLLTGLKYHLETGKFVTKENIKTILIDAQSLQAGESFSKNLQVDLAA